MKIALFWRTVIKWKTAGMSGTKQIKIFLIYYQKSFRYAWICCRESWSANFRIRSCLLINAYTRYWNCIKIADVTIRVAVVIFPAIACSKYIYNTFSISSLNWILKQPWLILQRKAVPIRWLFVLYLLWVFHIIILNV